MMGAFIRNLTKAIKWVLITTVAMAPSGAAIYYARQARELKAQNDTEIRTLQKQTQTQHEQVEKLQKDLQAKREAKAAEAALAAVVATPVPTPAPTPAPAPVVAYVAPTQPTGVVQAAIIKWAGFYGVSADWLLRIANCESHFNPGSVNYSYAVSGTHPSGIFQHVALYWPARAVHYGVAGASIFDYDAQARVTAGMFKDGQSGLWECR